MTLVWKVALGVLATVAVMFAIACGGSGDGDQRPSEGISRNEPSVLQQQQDKQDLEECPSSVRDMRCFVRAGDTITAGKNSYVEARGGTVYAETGSWVEAYPRSTVYAYRGSTIRWRVGAIVHIEHEDVDIEEVFD